MARGAQGGDLGGLVGTVVVIVAFVVVVGAPPTPTIQATFGPDEPDAVLQSAGPSGYDELVTRITVHRSGTASWQVNYRYELEDEAAERAFERVSRNITNPPGEFIAFMKDEAVDDAMNATGRSMTLQNGRVRTERSVPAGRYGIVSYQFQWTNFAARPAEDRLVVGDAFGGDYQLEGNDTMILEWPENLSKESVTPDPATNRTGLVSWTGPMKFRTTGPTLELAVPPEGASGPPVHLAVAIALLVFAAGGGWYAYTRRRRSEEATAADEPTPEPADELLSDEERVLRLLERRDGRMRQQDLLDEVEWSRTKTSDVVNEMHEAGQIEVFRLGRENVITLPGEIEI